MIALDQNGEGEVTKISCGPAILSLCKTLTPPESSEFDCARIGEMKQFSVWQCTELARVTQSIFMMDLLNKC